MITVGPIFATVASSGDNVVVCGGYNYYDGTHKECHFYNPTTDEWTAPVSMIEERADYAFGQLNNDDFWIIGKVWYTVNRISNVK